MSTFGHQLGGTQRYLQLYSNEIEKIVQLLLENGADPNVSVFDGGTALHHAARHGESKFIRFTIERPMSKISMEIHHYTSP